jgi:site-specific DNA-methyltransferase (adenine-specific)
MNAKPVPSSPDKSGPNKSGPDKSPPNKLHYGDNLAVLRNEIADASVDLVYLDPPFNSNADYNVLFKSPAGVESEAQIEAFKDTWHWTTDGAEKAYDEVLASSHTNAAAMLRAMRQALGENDMMAYLAMMAVRLIELHRVLKPTGSLYLHCDPTASHYLKILLDGIFGEKNFRNEIIWKRTSAHSGAKRWADVHDVLFFYSVTDDYKWNSILQDHDVSHVEAKYGMSDEFGSFMPADLTGAGLRNGDSGKPWRGFDPQSIGRHWAAPRTAPAERVELQDWSSLSSQQKLDRLDDAGLIYWPNKKSGFPRYKRYLAKGIPIQTVITDISPINSQAQERLGYPTQKPISLLDRIVGSSSDPDDVVLDPFCGCGTAIHAAEKLGRRWIGIDVTHLSISLIERRMRDAFPGIETRYEVLGTPKDLAGARELATRDKYQFQWWAVGQVGARPYKGKKKAADGGIDGIVYFKADKRTDRAAVVSVKGGDNIGVGAVRDLVAVLQREKDHAEIGILICAALPTRAMETEAAAAGFYKCEAGTFPRLQIVTLAELFQGKRPKLPFGFTGGTFKAAAREDLSEGRQGDLI